MEKYRRMVQSLGEPVYYTESKSGNIAAGATEDTDITAPDGYMIVPMAIAFTCNNIADATSGFYYLNVYNPAHNKETGIRNSRAYTNGLVIAYSDCLYNSATAYPADRAAYMNALSNLIIMPGETIRMRYTNDTDSVQTNNRIYRIYYRLIPVS